MESKQIRNMLDEEIVASGDFTRQNFGLQVGDGYPEIVREVVKSSRVSGHLMVMLLASALCGKDVAESLAQMKDANKSEHEDRMAKTILDHFEVFNTPLEFFYWGMQVGRKLERQESAMLRDMEKDSK